MRSMLRVILLTAVLSASLSFQQVAGGCFNGSYYNCATCYQTLANALIDTDDNGYSLSRAFFPPDTATPVVVKVTYHFKECDTSSFNATDCDRIWYWTVGTFYLYQPLEVFVYRSLFFSSPAVSQSSLELNLPDECRVNASDDFYMYLTQRLKAYATFQSAIPQVDNTYVATAVNGEKKINHKDDRERGVHVNSVLYAYHCVPFIIVFVLLTAVIIFGGISDYKLNKQSKNPLPKDSIKNTSQQANIAAIVAVCSCVTVHNFVLDMLSLHAEDNGDLPDYFEKNSGIFIYTAVFAIISLLFLIGGIIGFFVVHIIQVYRAKNEGSKETLGLFIPIALCIGSTVLSLSFHAQNIFIAWDIDPFYASRIALYYGVSIFMYILTFRHAYSLPVICCTQRQQATSENAFQRQEATPESALSREQDPANNESSAQPLPHENALLEQQDPNESVSQGQQATSENAFQRQEATPESALSREQDPANNESSAQPLPHENALLEQQDPNESVSQGQQPTSEDASPSPSTSGNDKWKQALAVGLSLFAVGTCLTAFHVTNVVFYYYVSINLSIEESASGVQAIYDSGILLIATLIAYNVGWYYFRGKKFSVERALKHAVKEMESPFEDSTRKKEWEKEWEVLSDEEQLKKIIKALLHHETVKGFIKKSYK